MNRYFLIFLILLSVSQVMGQQINPSLRPMGLLSEARQASFISLEIGASIKLPAESHGGGGSGGPSVNWRLSEGYFTVGAFPYKTDHGTGVDPGEKRAEIASSVYKSFTRYLFTTQSVSEKRESSTIKYEENNGTQIRYELDNAVCVVRVFLIKERAYFVAALLAGEQRKFEKEVLKTLGTFKLNSPKESAELLKKKVDENTPSPLPLSTGMRRPESDAASQNLKGKVRSVFYENQVSSGPETGNPRIKSAEGHFDEFGNLVKTVVYNYLRLPGEIAVYGYIDDKRVSAAKYIRYESQPPPMAPAARPGAKSPDNRYQRRYEYKYDEKGRPVETVTYDNRDSVVNRVVITSNGNAEERVTYNFFGELSWRTLTTYDDKGNPIEEIALDPKTRERKSVTSYQYLEFDAKGNWTKLVKTYSWLGSKTPPEKHITSQYRTIAYY